MCQMETSTGGSCAVFTQRCLLGYLGSYLMSQIPCYKVPFREGRVIMKCLGVVGASEADGLIQCVYILHLVLL